MTKLAALLFAAGLCAAGSAAGQSYPTRPIVVVVPFTAGGPTDALMRVLGERMRASLDQPLLVENVTGAAGTIGVAGVDPAFRAAAAAYSAPAWAAMRLSAARSTSASLRHWYPERKFQTGPGNSCRL